MTCSTCRAAKRQCTTHLACGIPLPDPPRRGWWDIEFHPRRNRHAALIAWGIAAALSFLAFLFSIFFTAGALLRAKGIVS